MSKMKRALEVVDNLRSLANSIEGFINGFSEDKCGESQHKSKTYEVAELNEEPKEKPHTLEEVRAKLAALSQSGKQAEVKKLITDFGAKKLSDIPEEKYPEVLEKLEEL